MVDGERKRPTDVDRKHSRRYVVCLRFTQPLACGCMLLLLLMMMLMMMTVMSY
jgi:hypothetical protein